VIPATGTFESRFGTCNCGKPAKNSVPCEHMVAVVKSSMIGGLSRIQIMPYWWTTAHWRTQYAVDVLVGRKGECESVCARQCMCDI
jgi:hypothetical protein